MRLAEDLLSQAYQLATLDPGRPKQANLRRAISSAYYAVFHLLVANAALKFIPKKPVGLVSRVGRAFLHGEMKQACISFNRKSLNEPLHSLIGPVASADMTELANVFITLQEARHAADYDTAAVFTRSDALDIWANAEYAFAIWLRIRNTDEATVFLAALAFGARWSK